MHKKLCCNMIFGFLFTVVIGALMHYAYEWSGNSSLVGLIAPVNESTWEHMKLIFFPMLVYSIFSAGRLRKNYPNISVGLSAGLILGTLLIPVLFYSYTGILGYHVLWLDISVFLLCALVAFLSAWHITIRQSLADYKPHFFFLIVLITLCFFFFTAYPPQIGLFQAPY